MNKIKQNKITFSLILAAIAIIFSSLTILSLPVLFNYKSKVTKIENNFYKNFKIYLKSEGKISYKPFPKPHFLVENASLNLSNVPKKEALVKTSNLKIFISLRDIYLRSLNNFISTEISNSNLELTLSDIKEFREHLYQKVNKPINFNNCKIFIRNKNNEVIIISPLKKITYKINNKTKIKKFIINGELFGLNFKSEWKRSYDNPETSFHDINIFNPIVEIKNIFQFKSIQKFHGKSEISYAQENLEYNIEFSNNQLSITSPEKENINFNINSKIQLNPFHFEGDLNIKNKKVEKIIDNFLANLLFYDENYLGNLNGNFKIKFNELNNKLIKNGELQLNINEKKINIKEAKFNLHKIGKVKTKISFVERNGDLKFISKNELNIENHIEFAKIFQIGSKKAKKIKKINFDLEKNVGDKIFLITNVKINSNEEKSKEIFLVKNIQNLRSHIRKVID